MSVFVHAQGINPGGRTVKKWQNSVHVVVECPLIDYVLGYSIGIGIYFFSIFNSFLLLNSQSHLSLRD